MKLIIIVHPLGRILSTFSETLLLFTKILALRAIYLAAGLLVNIYILKQKQITKDVKRMHTNN